jgi:tetratricopeptide (TPR) repeat protein
MHDGFGVPTFYRSFDTLFSRVLVEDFENGGSEFTFEDSSDIAIHYSHLLRFEDALALMQKIHRGHRNEYGVVANLGTMYELNGELDSAYFYIKRSIELNEEAHEGSEWVHLKILEAKMNMRDDPNWLFSNDVLGLKLQRINNDEEDNGHLIEDEAYDVLWQMRERIPFTSEIDLLMAKIFMEVGKSYEQNVSLADGYVCYQIGMFYDPNNVLGIGTLFNEVKPIYEANDMIEKNPFEYYFKPKEEFATWERQYSEVWKKYAIENGLAEADLEEGAGYTLATSRNKPFSLSSMIFLAVGSLGILVALLILKGRAQKRKR